MNATETGEALRRPIRFEPGEAVAIVGPGAICVVLDDPGSDLIAQLRKSILDDSTTESPLEVMVRSGGLDLPPFGLVVADGSQARVVVRGSVGATIDTVDGPVELTGDRVRTWLEHVAEGVRSVRVIADVDDPRSSGTPFYETTGGVLPVCVVEVGFASVADIDAGVAGTGGQDVFQPPPFLDVPMTPEQAPTLPEAGWEPDRHPDLDVVEVDGVEVDAEAEAHFVGEPEPVVDLLGDIGEPSVDDAVGLTVYEPEELIGEPSVEDPAGLTRHEPEPGPPPIVAGGPPVVVDHGATLIGPFDLLDESDEPVESVDALASRTGPGPIPTDVPPFHPTDGSDPGGTDTEGDDYDHLFGATQFRTVEQAAVRPDEDDDGHQAPAGGMISGIPGDGADVVGDGAAAGSGSEQSWLTAGMEDGDHDGHTVSLASLRAQLERSAPTPGVSPSVHAVYCPSGHLNPTHTGTCRACGLPIEDQEHVSVPRPVLGTITFTDGRVVHVSRPLLIGRSPKADGVLSGEPPELVVVPSPLKEISSTHVELRLEGWQVLVVDRQSTNGTVVFAPGRDPQRLRPGEPVPITPGTRVNLADETEFVFEVSQ